MKTSQKLSTKQKYQTQQKEYNTPMKLQSNQLKHLLQAVIIGLSNILLQVEMKVKFSPSKEKPISFHNIVITKIFNNTDLNLSTQINRNYKEIFLFNSLSEELQFQMKQTVKQLTGDDESINEMFIKGRERKTKREETQILKKFKTFDPLNEKGIELFGKKVMEIIVNYPEPEDEENKKQTFVILKPFNIDIWNEFIKIIMDDDCLTRSGKECLRDYFIQFNNQIFSQNEESNGNQTILYQSQSSQQQIMNTNINPSIGTNQMNENINFNQYGQLIEQQNVSMNGMNYTNHQFQMNQCMIQTSPQILIYEVPVQNYMNYSTNSDYNIIINQVNQQNEMF